jgi:hypothetical protein
MYEYNVASYYKSGIYDPNESLYYLQYQLEIKNVSWMWSNIKLLVLGQYARCYIKIY